MKLTSTLMNTVLVAVIYAGFAGCGLKREAETESDYASTSHREIAKMMENSTGSVYTTKLHHRALFNAALEVHQNNISLLKIRNIPYYPGTNFQSILELRGSAERSVNAYPAHPEKGEKEYHLAIHGLEMEILEQQRLLLQKE